MVAIYFQGYREFPVVSRYNLLGVSRGDSSRSGRRLAGRQRRIRRGREWRAWRETEKKHATLYKYERVIDSVITNSTEPSSLAHSYSSSLFRFLVRRPGPLSLSSSSRSTSTGVLRVPRINMYAGNNISDHGGGGGGAVWGETLWYRRTPGYHTSRPFSRTPPRQDDTTLSMHTNHAPL